MTGLIIADGGTIGSTSDTDAIAISSGGVVTFSQSPVGAGMDLLLDSTISSAAATIDISATYITSTYDTYILQGNLLPANDNGSLYLEVFVGGSVITAAEYHYETDRVGATNPANDDSHTFVILTDDGVGNVAGEGASFNLTLQNINDTAFPFVVHGFVSSRATDGLGTGQIASGGLLVAHIAKVVNGIRLRFGSGDTASGTVRLYGVKT